MSRQSKLVKLGAVAAAAAGAVWWASDVRCPLHSRVFVPAMHKFLDPEDAHKLAIWLAKHKLTPRDRKPDSDALKVSLFGRDLPNPICLAAGFDKDAEAVDGLLHMGFAAVEVGSVTPEPQSGNPRPRVFRVLELDSVINRYGFNSRGHSEALSNLLRHGPRGTKLVGVNLGKNKTCLDASQDYEKGVRAFAQYADYLVINVSSPNTPGLRNLQAPDELEALLQKVLQARGASANPTVPLCVKIAPDLDPSEMRQIAALARKLKLDGIVVSNTTTWRPKVESAELNALMAEKGGLSGRLLLAKSLDAVRTVHAELKGSGVKVIGCGGVTTWDEAIAMARAGASVVQIYSAVTLKGPTVLANIKDGVSTYLQECNLTWPELIGTETRT